jgi:hypothetical protein
MTEESKVMLSSPWIYTRDQKTNGIYETLHTGHIAHRISG